ncbi:MAG: TonB-dependent receptor plug domain-containing protein [Cyanothece sp. SIO1E1]|nr:TonB-dependent receptor plug domain-containing protein [Cyanothece sp. SIO1E1]
MNKHAGDVMEKFLQYRNFWAILAVVSLQVAIAESALAQEPITIPDQVAQTEVPLVPITAVRLESTETGFQVVLEAAERELATPTTTVSGNALIAEIANAVLALPEDDEFLQFEPAEGIASVQVTGLPDNRVQITITGTDAPPAIDISSGSTGLALSATPGDPTAPAPDHDSIQIVVMEEAGSRYFKPNATTATRTDTPIRDIPHSIQVIPRELLEDQQVIRLDEALRNVSGVNFEGTDFGRGLQFSIRGFEDAPVLRNGFRQFEASQSFPETINLEQIEVLKGPASILYGEINPGGVINLVTKRPLEESFYKIETQVGNRDLIRPSIDFSGPLTADSRLLYRLNAVYQSGDDIQNFDTDTDRFFVSPVLAWQIGDRTDLMIELEYLDEERTASTGIPAFGEGIADIPFDQIVNEPDDFFEEQYFNIGYELEHRFNDNWKLRNGFRYTSRDTFQELTLPGFLDEETGILQDV